MRPWLMKTFPALVLVLLLLSGGDVLGQEAPDLSPSGGTLAPEGTVIVATHDLNFANQFADRVLLLSEGKVVKAGRADEVLRPEVLEPVYSVGFEAVGDASGTKRWTQVPVARMRSASAFTPTVTRRSASNVAVRAC